MCVQVPVERERPGREKVVRCGRGEEGVRKRRRRWWSVCVCVCVCVVVVVVVGGGGSFWCCAFLICLPKTRI